MKGLELLSSISRYGQYSLKDMDEVKNYREI